MSRMTIAITFAALCAPAWAGTVNVDYHEPETFRDASDRGLYSMRATESVMNELRAHFQAEGAKYLAADETLDIEVRDIDLAGRYEPGYAPGFQDVRIMRDSTWPSMEFHYRLTRGDSVVQEGDADIADLNYMLGARNLWGRGTLAYDKRMIDTWFREQFETRTTAAR